MESEAIKVLLVDDDQGDFEMTRAMLSQAEHGEFRLDWVSTFEEAVDAFGKRDHDVYLLDYFLEDRTGLDLLDEANRQGIREPIIMLTGRGSRRVDEEAMSSGAADYLVKGRIDPEILERAIRYALDRNRASRALKESEERHRSMFDHLPVGLYRSAPDGTFIDANPALIRILGYPDRSSLQNHFASALYVHPDDRGRLWNLLDRYGVVRGFESSLRRLDGTTIRVRNTVRLHRDPEGNVLYLEGTLEDISAEERADAFFGGEARFRALFETSGIGIAVVDLEGFILETNPAFANLFGSSKKDMEGVSYADLLMKDDQPAVQRELDALAKGDQTTMTAERRFVTGSGEELWARASLTLIRRSDGEPDQILAVLNDPSQGEF